MQKGNSNSALGRNTENYVVDHLKFTDAAATAGCRTREGESGG